MIGPLRFKAQALDNASPDEYQTGGTILPEHDRSSRLGITEEIATISRLGKIRYHKNGAELILYGRRFLAQVISEQRDVAGRQTAILCCGEFDRRSDPAAEAAMLVAGIRDFATAIGRSVAPMQLEAVRIAVSKLAGERASRRLLIGLAIIAVAGAAVAAGIAVSVRDPAPSQAHGQTR